MISIPVSLISILLQQLDEGLDENIFSRVVIDISLDNALNAKVHTLYSPLCVCLIQLKNSSCILHCIYLIDLIHFKWVSNVVIERTHYEEGDYIHTPFLLGFDKGGVRYSLPYSSNIDSYKDLSFICLLHNIDSISPIKYKNWLLDFISSRELLISIMNSLSIWTLKNEYTRELRSSIEERLIKHIEDLLSTDRYKDKNEEISVLYSS